MTPITLFAFNRPAALRHTVDALLRNPEAAQSDLYVFVDGPRPDRAGEAEKVQAVRDYVQTITGFQSLHYTFSDTNKGLGPSIISGVTQVINRYGSVIVVEDDLVVSSNFLTFMNQGLEHYQGDQHVFSICGYSNRVKRPKGYDADAYLCVRSSSWGWATWADRWATVDWELSNWSEHAGRAHAFNRWGGSDCFRMLKGWHEGRNKSWAIRFCYNQFLQDKLSLFPLVSKVGNEGFDGQGTNCKTWSRFRYDLDTTGRTDFRFPNNVELNPQLYRSAMRYNSLAIRAWSKLMYTIHR